MRYCVRMRYQHESWTFHVECCPVKCPNLGNGKFTFSGHVIRAKYPCNCGCPWTKKIIKEKDTKRDKSESGREREREATATNVSNTAPTETHTTITINHHRTTSSGPSPPSPYPSALPRLEPPTPQFPPSSPSPVAALPLNIPSRQSEPHKQRDTTWEFGKLRRGQSAPRAATGIMMAWEILLGGLLRESINLGLGLSTIFMQGTTSASFAPGVA